MTSRTLLIDVEIPCYSYCKDEAQGSWVTWLTPLANGGPGIKPQEVLLQYLFSQASAPYKGDTCCSLVQEQILESPKEYIYNFLEFLLKIISSNVFLGKSHNQKSQRASQEVETLYMSVNSFCRVNKQCDIYSCDEIPHTNRRDWTTDACSWLNLKCFSEEYSTLFYCILCSFFHVLINFKSLKFSSNNIISRIRASLNAAAWWIVSICSL